MNDRQQLEPATSRQISDRLDDETATLREGWLGLGQSIDVANTFDEQAALAQLQRTFEAERRIPQAPARQHADGYPYSGFLLAAALLILAAFTIGIVQRPRHESIATATDMQAHGPGNSRAITAGPWSDELDADLDAAVLRIQEVSWQPTSLDASLIKLDGRMVELSSDISGGSL